MTEDDSNSTLLDFDGSSDDGDAEAVGPEADEETVGADGSDDSGDTDDAVAVRDPGSVSPAVSTSRFVPGGESCASCGASTRRLWVAEGDAVCIDCKPW